MSCSTPASRAKCQITLTFVTLMGDTLQLVLLEICLNFWLYPCCAQWVKLHSEGVILVFMHLCFHEIFKITSSLNIYEHLMNIYVCCHCFLNPVKEMQVGLWCKKHKGYLSMKIRMLELKKQIHSFSIKSKFHNFTCFSQIVKLELFLFWYAHLAEQFQVCNL